MFKRLPISCAVALALGAPQGALAVDTYAYIKNETAVFTNDGQPTGSESNALDNSDSHDAGDLLKFENQARLYVNGEFTRDLVWHAELLAIYDTEAIDDGGVEYQGHRLYSQQDFLRELYVDYYGEDWGFRIGKQQVVWGTADGIKLLDIINPTDFRELNQNRFEDSRIPIWMVKGERLIGDSSNIQFIVAQHEENKIPGLNSDGDSGHPFVLKGVDTITGEVNGFRNIAPALSNVAGTFNSAAFGGAFTGGNPVSSGLNLFSGLTVDGFASNFWDPVSNPGQLAGTTPADPNAVPGAILLNSFAQFGFTGQPGFPPGVNDPNGNFNETNLMPATGPQPQNVDWDPSGASSAFEYMSNATFATFNTFSNFVDTANPALGFTGTQTQYRRDYPDDENVNAGFRFKHRMDNGFNFSLNYFYHYSANPSIDLSWHDANTGQELTVQRAATQFLDSNGTPGPQPDDTYIPDVTTDLTRDQARANHSLGNSTTILVHDGGMNSYYGALDPTAVLGQLADGNPSNDPIAFGAGAPALRFTERLHRVHSFGASFDYAVDGLPLPVVLRGEFLYDQDDMQPIVDKYLLSIGDLTNALQMEEADYFKYVIGVDVTVLTNMLVSGQFIQFRNLDYVDEGDSCTTQGGRTVDCSRYTADFPTLHLDNGLNKAYENKEFYSLFFSKPFGPSDEHRWNNITIYEEGGGWWNRFDVEYSFTDTLLGTAEYNAYWGDDDTQFGQFQDSSNFQVGIKYLIE